jgi:molybdopterin synthase sulfur carrier subunit
MRVTIPSALHSYTGGLGEVEVPGATLAELMAALDARYPGLRFRVIDEQDRIRPHMRLFVGTEMARTLATSVAGADEVHILLALSGG